MVEPEEAELWLTNHNKINRPKRFGAIEKYLRDHLNDKWLTTHEAIAFDYNGQMIDGQHRAEMIARAKKAAKTVICLGLEPRVRMVVDIGIPRRPHDILKLNGFDSATPWSVAIVRQTINSINRRATMMEIFDAYKRLERKAQIIMAMFPNKKAKLTTSPICAVMLRALQDYPEERIQDFAEFLYEGLAPRANKGNNAVVMLRDWLMKLPAIGGNADRAVYSRTEAALYAYLNNIRLDKLEPATEELFPMRGDGKLKPLEVITIKPTAATVAA
jgi:hypothetical protein